MPTFAHYARVLRLEPVVDVLDRTVWETAAPDRRPAGAAYRDAITAAAAGG